MTAAGSLHPTPATWRSVLPAGRAYVALPNRARPVVVADRDPDVLEYVRTTLLARPPGGRGPGWAYEAARRGLRVPRMWSVVPRLHPEPPESAELEPSLDSWIADSGLRVVILDHSHDQDRRFVLLLFPAGCANPSIAVKVAACAEANDRIEAERVRLQELESAPIGALRSRVPRCIELPVPVTGATLATTAQPGMPMFVRYYRNGHNRRPAGVAADLTAARMCLAQLQREPTGPPLRLDIAGATLMRAEAQLVDRSPQLRRAVSAGLRKVRGRLRQYRARSYVVHGDFWPGNILIDGSVVSGLVDWERWEPAGSPIRDLGRFAVSHSLYLDRHTRPGHRVRGHAGLIARDIAGGVGYALHGRGWYPTALRRFVITGLQRLGLPSDIGPDVMLAELAAVAAEATDPAFAQQLWQIFAHLAGER